MADQEQAGLIFVVEGQEYPAPDVNSLNMGERRVLYDLASVVQEDFARDEDEDTSEYDERVRKLTRHPGFIEALMHIAYARGNPDVKRDKVQAVINRTNFLEAIEKWGAQQEQGDDVGPPVRTSEPEESSPESSLKKIGTSGDGSTNGSAEPDKTPSAIGTTRSAISPTFDPMTLDA